MSVRPEVRDRWVVRVVAALSTLVILAPLAAPGYVLRFDMVFVPRQALRWQTLAPVVGLPRAVPEDAVVAIANLIAPGWMVQRVALAAAIYLAGVGAARLVPAGRLLTRVIAAVGYVWTAYLVERLLLGQWGLLLAYAALPWLIKAAIGVRAGTRGSLPRLILAAALCAITPTGGLLALLTVVVLTVDRARWRASAAAISATVALKAPWLIAALIAEAGGRSDPAGVAAFAARGENWAGPVVALAGTGGIWNSLTTPLSRASVLTPLVTATMVALAIVGWPWLARRWPAGAAARLGWLAAIGFVLAMLGVIPITADLLGWWVSHVPGGGMLRDGQKFVAPYAVLVVVASALGVERAVARLTRPRARMVLVAAALMWVVALPDLAVGAAGALRPVRYPADWDRVAALVTDSPGEVLVLPMSEYRRYPWNADRTVIDPAPRYLPVDVVTDDTLVVGDIVVEGESPRAEQIRRLIADGEPIADTGIRWVLVEHESGRDNPGGESVVAASVLRGLRPALRGPVLDLYENPRFTAPPTVGVGRRWLFGAVYASVLGLIIAAIWWVRRTPST